MEKQFHIFLQCVLGLRLGCCCCFVSVLLLGSSVVSFRLIRISSGMANSVREILAHRKGSFKRHQKSDVYIVVPLSLMWKRERIAKSFDGAEVYHYLNLHNFDLIRVI